MKREILEVYFIAGTQNIANTSLPELLEEALDAGITAFQLREKGSESLENNLEARKEIALACQRLCHDYGVPFIINDDVDFAIEIDADGVHVGQGDEPIQEVVDRMPAGKIIGYSTSNLAQVQKAEQIAGIDYLGLGPVYSSLSKSDADPALGLDGMQAIMDAGVSLPVVAIGGITVENASAVKRTGVDGVSVISAIARANDVTEAVRQLKKVKE